uniref:Uncharacterized protein n=1 Tax=Arundo donax TaxID=35708 RepID=A0A0A9BJ61_ARUDO
MAHVDESPHLPHPDAATYSSHAAAAAPHRRLELLALRPTAMNSLPGARARTAVARPDLGEEQRRRIWARRRCRAPAGGVRRVQRRGGAQSDELMCCATTSSTQNRHLRRAPPARPWP